MEGVEELTQIKWIFNKQNLRGLSKNQAIEKQAESFSEQEIEVFMEALRGVEIPKEVIKKWVKPPADATKDEFLKYIKANFNTIILIQ